VVERAVQVLEILLIQDLVLQVEVIVAEILAEEEVIVEDQAEEDKDKKFIRRTRIIFGLNLTSH